MGFINEETSSHPSRMVENSLRVVDRNYPYVLSVPSLAGMGTYYVEIKIDGEAVPTPGSPGGLVTFDLT